MNIKHYNLNSKSLAFKLFQIICLICSLQLSAANFHAQVPVPGNVLEKQITVSLQSVSVKDALLYISGKSKVRIGFIGVIGDEGNKKVTLDIRQGSVRQVLNELITQVDSYKWDISNDIINVLPTYCQNKVAALKIDFLELSDKKLDEVGTAILDAPEVRIGITNMGVSKTEELKYSGAPRRSLVSIVLSNQTVREGLNEIASKGFASFWSLEMRGEKNEFVRIMLY